MSFTLPLLGIYFYRSLISVLLLFIMAKIIGPRQIAQMTFYDYVLGISTGSIAAAMAIDTRLPLWGGAVALLVYALISISMALSGSKSIHARRFFTGKPEILLYKGQFLEKHLKRNHLDVNDVTSLSRVSGYFDLDDLEYIIIEPNGALSFLPKSEKAPLTPKDVSRFPADAVLSANVIIDGNIMKNHLQSIGKNTIWLRDQLESINIHNESEVLLATADEQGHFRAFLKDHAEKNTDLFD